MLKDGESCLRIFQTVACVRLYPFNSGAVDRNAVSCHQHTRATSPTPLSR